MVINGVVIDETYAEGFLMKATRVIVTAQTAKWAYNAAVSMTGFATSVIGCGCEADIESVLNPSKTPDGRPGVSIMLFARDSEGLKEQLLARARSCVLNTPTSALFSGIEAGIQIRLFQQDLNFVRGFHEIVGQVDAIGGGNLLIMTSSTQVALNACEKAVSEIRKVPNVILPFPGGVVRSGSKIGSKYKNLKASTNDALCPTLKGMTKTSLPAEIETVMEIVIDGLAEADIKKAMRAGIKAFCSMEVDGHVKRISAGNYGGKLGQYHFHLREILAEHTEFYAKN